MLSFADILAAPQDHIYDTYAELRETDDGILVDAATGFVLVSRHHDVGAVLRDAKNFSSEVYWKAPVPIYDPRDHIQAQVVRLVERFLPFIDGPVHARLRSLVRSALTPRAIDGMRDAIEANTAEILDTFGDGEGAHVDFATEIAEKLPIWIIATIMGFPMGDRASLRNWTVSISSTMDPGIQGPARVSAFHDVAEFVLYLRSLIEHRRKNPGTDLISTLIGVEADGDRLTSDELIIVILVLLAAGNNSATYTLNNGLNLLLEHPVQRTLLAARPQVCGTAVEEILRIEPPVRWVARLTRGECVLGGHTVPPDTFVWLAIGAANRDPRVFDAPDTFDICRDAGAHLAFSAGPHFCMGSGLGRLQSEIFFVRFLQRFPGVTRNGPVSYSPAFIDRAMTRFPVSLRR